MKFAKLTQKSSLILACAFIFALGIYAQKPVSKQEQTSKTSVVLNDGKETVKNIGNEKLSEEESAILPYYNNYLKEYHLGPEDIISVEVFGQPAYSKASIVIPPTSRIAYPLISGGVFVGGRTTEQVSEEIKKKLDEYIIDPDVTVTLDKVGSARFSILGKVATPGVKVMNRRYNIYEAVAEAGGIAKEGDKKRVMLVRLNPQGGFTQMIIDFDKLLGGKTEIPYLVPGDQIIVPEKKWSLTKILDIVSKASIFGILF
ncbi:MAG: polysaccharide biosynthesis/export family protein [Pyrinomonadaceae bacterium]